MVDESCVVAINGRVDHDVVVDCEQEGVMPLTRHVGIARLGLHRREPLSGVFDQPRAGGNAPRRERAQPLHGRRTDLERRLGRHPR